MKQLKSIQVPKQSHLLDKFISEKSIYSDRNFFLNQYRTINKLLKLNYPYYYKYNYNLYMFLKKLYYLNFWRISMKPGYMFIINTPFYKFLPQIYLKEYLFYKNLTDTQSQKKLYILTKKHFSLTPYLKLHSRYFTKVLPGGLNSFFLHNNTINDEPVLIDKTSLIQKKLIKFTELQNFNFFLESISLIFFISLSNYILFYNIFIQTVYVRL